MSRIQSVITSGLLVSILAVNTVQMVRPAPGTVAPLRVIATAPVPVITELGRVTPTWEYRILSVSDTLFDETMGALGGDGWELVTARRASNGSSYTPVFSYECIFKRVGGRHPAPTPTPRVSPVESVTPTAVRRMTPRWL